MTVLSADVAPIWLWTRPGPGPERRHLRRGNRWHRAARL